MVARRWDGLCTRQIAEELGCHPETVRHRMHAFNARGLEGLGIKPGSGRTPRLTQLERRTILALVHLPPPGTPTDHLPGALAAPDPEAEPEWTLATLAPAPPPSSGASTSRAARCGASSGTQACAGVTRGSGPGAKTRISSPEFHKGRDRRALPRPAARRRDRPLRRRTRPGTPAHFPPCAGLVARWPPHHGPAHL